MTSDQRHAHTIRLEERQLGMLSERRRDRRLRAAERLCRIHVNNAANALQMTATDWTIHTFDGNGLDDLAIRVSARLIPWQPIPPELLEAGPTSAEAFRAWEAPRRAVYEAAREAAIARLEPAFEQLGRMIDDIANPPRYITVDEEHVITADQLAETRPQAWLPAEMWMASTAGPQHERHAEAFAILDRLRQLLDEMHTGPNMLGRATNLADVLHHHLDAIRRLVLHHQDLETRFAKTSERNRPAGGPSDT